MPFGLVGMLGLGTPVVAAILAYTLSGLDALGDVLEALGISDRPGPLQAKRFILR